MSTTVIESTERVLGQPLKRGNAERWEVVYRDGDTGEVMPFIMDGEGVQFNGLDAEADAKEFVRDLRDEDSANADLFIRVTAKRRYAPRIGGRIKVAA